MPKTSRSTEYEKARSLPWYRFVLPKIISTLTRESRYLPEIEWSDDSISFNLFRAWEWIAFRRAGIRAEATSINYKGREYHYFHSAEAAIVHLEAWIRGLAEIPSKVRVYIPVLQPVGGGFPIPASPYLFAIAYDTHSHTTSAGSTLSHTVTGSNPALVAQLEKLGASTYTMTYNGTTIVLLDNYSSNTQNQSGILINPTTGSHTLSSTGNGTHIRVVATSYSGVGTGSDTGGSDTHGGAQGTTSGTLSNNLTFTANAWANLYAIGANTLPSATAVCTTERSGGSIDASKVWDSNGGLTAGSHNVTSTFTDTSFCQLVVGLKNAAVDVSVSPTTLAALFSIPAYVVTAIQNLTFSSTTLSATFSIPTYAVSAGATVTAPTLSATFSIPTYQVIAGNVNYVPSTLSATFSIPSYTVKTGVTVFPSTLSATFSIPSATVDIGANIAAPTLSMSLSIPTYTVSVTANPTISATTLSMTFSVPTYSVALGIDVHADPLSLTFSIPTYTVSVTANIVILPEPLVLTFSLPQRGLVGGVWRRAPQATDEWSKTPIGE